VIGILLGQCACGGARMRAPDRRAFYVRDATAFTTRTGDRAWLDRLVGGRWVSDVIPYGVAQLLATPAGADTLAGWIDGLHRAGARVIVPIGGTDRLHALASWLATHPATWIDGLVTEFEYWNQADRAGALEDMLALVRAMRAQALDWQPRGHPVLVAAYLGYPTAAEAIQIAAAVDAVFLNYSVRAPAAAWSYDHGGEDASPQRFAWFACAGRDIWPIFYAAGEVDMAAALTASGLTAAEHQFRADMAAAPQPCAYRITGFAYFTLEALRAPAAWR